mmetsp:Transcript_44185/g.111340  ORF Transcript_44185/g.111340 Transcript_44185/m.111340 type:complete len:210 (-) Transcript_44185:86-715(-)
MPVCPPLRSTAWRTAALAWPLGCCAATIAPSRGRRPLLLPPPPHPHQRATRTRSRAAHGSQHAAPGAGDRQTAECRRAGGRRPRSPGGACIRARVERGRCVRPRAAAGRGMRIAPQLPASPAPRRRRDAPPAARARRAPRRRATSRGDGVAGVARRVRRRVCAARPAIDRPADARYMRSWPRSRCPPPVRASPTESRTLQQEWHPGERG